MASPPPRHDTKTAELEAFPDEANKKDATSSAYVEDVARVVDHKAERALCRRFDIRILPILAIMCEYVWLTRFSTNGKDLFNALDKGNLGNAETDGMSDDLHFEKGQYNLLLSVFFIPYVIFAPPFAMLGKRYSPARVLPGLMFSFGSFALLSAAAYNFGGLFALRWFLGMLSTLQ